jgi:hypothetical protein
MVTQSFGFDRPFSPPSQMPVLYLKSRAPGAYRNLKKPVEGEKFIAIEVSNSVYQLEVVAVSKNWDKIEDPELADGPDWFTTCVAENYVWEGWYYAAP